MIVLYCKRIIHEIYYSYRFVQRLFKKIVETFLITRCPFSIKIHFIIHAHYQKIPTVEIFVSHLADRMDDIGEILLFHYLSILITYPYTENWMEDKFIGRIIRLYLPN